MLKVMKNILLEKQICSENVKLRPVRLQIIKFADPRRPIHVKRNFYKKFKLESEL